MKEIENYTLHYDPRSPLARIILILLKELEIKVNEKIIDLTTLAQKKPEFLHMNPRGLVPVLDIGGDEYIGESRAIARYLIGSFPEISKEKNLVSDDVQLSYEIDRMLWISIELEHVIMNYLNVPGVIFQGSKRRDEKVDHMRRMLDTLQTNLKKYDQQYVAGPNLTIADLFCAMPIYTMSTMLEEDGSIIKEYPTIENWMKKLTTRSSWIESNRRGPDELGGAYKRASRGEIKSLPPLKDHDKD